MANGNNTSLTKANFGPKGWAVCIYMFFIFYLNTSMNSAEAPDCIHAAAYKGRNSL